MILVGPRARERCQSNDIYGEFRRGKCVCNGKMISAGLISRKGESHLCQQPLDATGMEQLVGDDLREYKWCHDHEAEPSTAKVLEG